MFNKLVAIEPVGLQAPVQDELNSLAETVQFYNNIPKTEDEIVKRITDADAVLVSYTTHLTKSVLERCPKIKYIGMCCSLYSPESANVDIKYAKSRDIVVTGIRDYGDEGVVEYVISELVRCLHGFEKDSNDNYERPWFGTSSEIKDLRCGILGLGKTGGMIADAISYFGGKISYFGHSEKPEGNAKGYRFVPLERLLSENEVIFCCLNRNVVLLHETEFTLLGNHKILFNTGLSPAWDLAPFEKWLKADKGKSNRFYCDSIDALGNKELLDYQNVHCMQVSSGRTMQASTRLSEKVLVNIKSFLQTKRIQGEM